MFENQGIEIIVVDSPIDDINALQAEGCSHVDDIIVNHQIPSLDQFYAHLPRQVRVFKIRRVVGAGRQQNDGWLRTAFGRQGSQGRQKRRRSSSPSRFGPMLQQVDDQQQRE